jgi:hypothetical protein
VFAIGPLPPSILRELDISHDVRLPDDYDDGPFAVPELRSDPDLPVDDEEDTLLSL